MKKFLDTRLLLTTGLVSLVVSVLLAAVWLGVMPDRRAASREARAAIAETVAAGIMNNLSAGEFNAAQEFLEFLIERNGLLKSAALRKVSGETMVVAGKHPENWVAPPQGKSTESEIVVPLSSDGAAWGQLELRFARIDGDEWWSFVLDERVQLVAFVALGCFTAFYFYLRRMLRHLDPSRAVPERVRNALDTLAEGLLLIDPKGQVVLANQAFANLVGEPAEKLLGRRANAFSWLASDGLPMAASVMPWTRAMQTGEIQRSVFVALKNSAGQLRSFHSNCSPIAGANESVGGVLMSLDDITELQEKEAQLREASERAETANRAKSDFLANMSHEIRTPMNAILGFTELMRRGITKGEADTRKQLNTIHTNGKHLLDLINDILDLSKVEAGQLEVEAIECEPHRVAHEVIDVLGVKAREKGIGLSFHQDGPIPEHIYSDPARLRQILTNLVGNAIKFTTVGEVSITERLVPSDTGAVLELSIRDTGIGVAQDKLSAIFEPFVQAESSTTRKYGGTGLGLSISRKFARAMGGDILCESALGKGSVFRVRINPGNLAQVRLLDEAAIQATFATETTTENYTWMFGNKRILVVDDSVENRELIRLILSDTGLTVVQAENGQIAVDLALAQPFDLILMDMQMPVMDGYTATRHLRDRGIAIPIVAFTAHAIAGFEKQILGAGCTDYLTKPIDIDLTLSLLGKLLQGRRVLRESASLTATPRSTDELNIAQAATASPALSIQSEHSPIYSRLAVNTKLHNVINAFVLRLPSQVAEMQAACMRGDFGTLADLAHWLKGSAGSVGFDTFTSPAKKLEDQARKNDSNGTLEALAIVVAMTDRVRGPNSQAPDPQLEVADRNRVTARNEPAALRN